jgi:hypothetical protein
MVVTSNPAFAMVTTWPKSTDENLAVGLCNPRDPTVNVQVVETGAYPHTRDDGFARRVTDFGRVVLRDTLVLRFRRFSEVD